MSNTFAHYTTSPFVLTKNRASNLNLFIVLIYFFPNGTQVQSQISFKEEELCVCLYAIHWVNSSGFALKSQALARTRTASRKFVRQ